jgi:hypothetical protein
MKWRMKKMNRKQLRSLTPEAAWKFFTAEGETVEGFISEFVDDGYELTDIKTMVRIFASETPMTLDHPLLQEDIDFLEASFEKYMMEHIEKIGGFANLKLMPHDELMKRWDDGVADMFYLMERRGYKIQNPRIKQLVEEKYYR